jgi:hypothetical protein
MAEMTIRRFGVMSVAKMYALVMFIFGLIIGVIYGLSLMVFGAAMSAIAPDGGDAAAAGGIGTVVLGLGMMIGMPLFYGLLGFIMGAIFAVVYNILAGIVGGIKFDLEGVAQEYAPPPPPHQWAPNQSPAQ